jgi:hypothetical protein
LARGVKRSTCQAAILAEMAKENNSDDIRIADRLGQMVLSLSRFAQADWCGDTMEAKRMQLEELLRVQENVCSNFSSNATMYLDDAFVVE